MMAIDGIGGCRSAGCSYASEHVTGSQDTGLPILPNDSGTYALGIDFAAAMLASKSAEATAKLAKEGQRAAKQEQVLQQRAQAESLHEKAAHTCLQAVVSGTASIAGGAMSAAGALTHGDTTQGTTASRVWTALGSMSSACAQPAGNLSFGARIIEDEADSTAHATEAKTAESGADEYAALEKQARGVLEKATSVMQSLVQERQAVARAILRAG